MNDVWHNIASLLDEYPHLDFNGEHFSFEGYLLRIRCRSEGASYVGIGNVVHPTQECIDRHKVICGQNYLEEVLPNAQGCLLEGGRTGIGASVLNLSEHGLSDTLWELPGFTTDQGMAVRTLALEMLRHGFAITDQDILNLVGAPLLNVIDDLPARSLSNLTTVSEFPFPGTMRAMLDPQRTSVEQRRITLPSTGEIELSVVRLDAARADEMDSPTMDLLEHSVRTTEAFIGAPFPTKHAIVVVSEAPRNAGGGDVTLSTIGGSDDIHFIAHEIGHSYTMGPQLWTNEGSAELLAAIARQTLDGKPLPDAQSSCSLASNISELVRIERDVHPLITASQDEIYSSGCNYDLGYGMFAELYQTLGDAAFRESFRTLYLLSRNEDPTLKDECTGLDSSLCYVREAFMNRAPNYAAAIAYEIINRRYYGSSFQQ